MAPACMGTAKVRGDPDGSQRGARGGSISAMREFRMELGASALTPSQAFVSSRACLLQACTRPEPAGGPAKAAGQPKIAKAGGYPSRWVADAVLDRYALHCALHHRTAAHCTTRCLYTPLNCITHHPVDLRQLLPANWTRRPDSCPLTITQMTPLTSIHDHPTGQSIDYSRPSIHASPTIEYHTHLAF